MKMLFLLDYAIVVFVCSFQISLDVLRSFEHVLIITKADTRLVKWIRTWLTLIWSNDFMIEFNIQFLNGICLIRNHLISCLSSWFGTWQTCRLKIGPNIHRGIQLSIYNKQILIFTPRTTTKRETRCLILLFLNVNSIFISKWARPGPEVRPACSDCFFYLEWLMRTFQWYRTRSIKA